MKDNHANDIDSGNNFVAFETPVPYQEAKLVGPEHENRIRATSASAAEEQLRNGSTAALAIFLFHEDPTAEECQAVLDFIKSHEFLTKIEIHMTSKFITYEDAVAILVQGLVTCKSIKMIAWSMPCSARKNPRNVTSIKSLVEENKQLEVLLFLRPPYRLGCGCCEDEFASCLFEALQKNRTIKTFRFDTCSRLSQNTKELAWQAVISNPSLIQLHTNFKEEDSHLNMLTTFNRHPRWMQCWTDVAASADDRIRVIDEIILNSESEQVVPFLFYLFQNFPEALRM
jgi:hypothetical protein